MVDPFPRYVGLFACWVYLKSASLIVIEAMLRLSMLGDGCLCGHARMDLPLRVLFLRTLGVGDVHQIELFNFAVGGVAPVVYRRVEGSIGG